MSLTINGISSDTLGVVVESYPARVIPARKQAAFDVIGRNGDIVDFYGGLNGQSFSNYVQSYEIYLNAEANGLEDKARTVASWLYNMSTSLEPGYSKIEDSYSSDCYRLGYFVGPLDVESTLARFGRCTVNFNCKPQRFFNSGRNSILLTTGLNTFTNPSIISPFKGYASRPYIRFNNLTGPLTLQFSQVAGSRSYYLDAQDQGDYEIDCEFETVNGPNGIDFTLLEYVDSYDLPTLYTTLKITPDAGTSFDASSYIIPNWWTL